MTQLNFRMLRYNQIHCCGNHGYARLLFSAPNSFLSSRRVVYNIQAVKDDSKNFNVKKAILSAKKKERIKLPYYENSGGDKICHISEFVNHPTGIEAMLNVNALAEYVPINANTYRCTLPPIQLLSFEVAPVLDLQVNSSTEGCTVELLSCEFQGSEIVESQNKYFSASMINFMTWDENGSETFLNVDVKLDISLEIYSQPFKLLPVSAVEGPGNLVVQALLERLVPLLVEQLLQDYDSWAKQQKSLPEP